MTILFADTFTGSGTLNGHTPGTTLGSEVWVNATDGMNLSGGFAVAVTNTVGGPGGSASVGDGVTSYTAGINTLITTFSFRTGSDISFAAYRLGASLNLAFNGAAFSAQVICDAVSNWQLSLSGDTYANVTLAANTTYSGTLTISDGAQTLTMLGQTITDTLTYVDTSGYNAVYLYVGDQFSIGPVSSVTASVAALTLPMLTGSAVGRVPALPKRYFQDDFSGTSAVNGTTPTVVFTPTDAWATTSAATSKSGGLVSADATSGGAKIAFTELFGPRSGEFRFSMRTGTLPTGGTVGEFWRIALINTAGGGLTYDAIQVSVGNFSGSVYTLQLAGPGGTWSSTPVTLASNTTYTGLLAYSPGVQNLTFLGTTRSTSEAFPDATVGITAVDYFLVAPAKLGPISLDFAYPGIYATLPHLTLAATGTGTALAGATMNLPMFTMVGFSGLNVSLTLPMLTGYSAGHDSTGEWAADLTLPFPVLAALGGANSALSLPTMTGSATGTVTIMGNGAAELPALTLAATGKVAYTGDSAQELPMFSLIGYSGAVVSIELSGYTFSATGTVGGVGGITATLPMFELVVSATAQNHGGADLLLPMFDTLVGAQAWLALPSLQLVAIGSATITATYEAYALNLNHTPVPGQQPVDELTHYTNFPFTHVVRYQNSYYGVAAGALYLLEGTTDNAVPISYEVQTAKTDFGTPDKKTLISTYFGGRIGAAETVKLIVGETGSQSYSYTTPRGPSAQNYRQKFGRGIKTRYYALGVEGSDVFELDALDFEINKLTRRI